MEIDKSLEEVDPRVQIELERLNNSTDEINRLEVDLDEARAGFRQLLYESTVKIDTLAKKLGNCVERARPYYEARIKAKEALQETQQAARRFERANSAHAAAKEMVFLAEEGLCAEGGRAFDHAWQEMLNHATMRVNESETERTLSESEHRRTSLAYHRAELRAQQLQKELKRAIAKSSLRARRSLLQINSLAYQHERHALPYFEAKAEFNTHLEEQKRQVRGLESHVAGAKASYAHALRNLETISDEIHRTRKGSALSPTAAAAVSSSVGASDPLGANESRSQNLSSTVVNSNLRKETVAELAICSQDTRQSLVASPRRARPLPPPPLLPTPAPPPPIGSFPAAPVQTSEAEMSTVSTASAPVPASSSDSNDDQVWTEISLLDSPEEPAFAKMGRSWQFVAGRESPLEISSPPTTSSSSTFASLRIRNPFAPSEEPQSPPSQPSLSRRQSLDQLLWTATPATEKVKELLSHGMMMLSLGERRSSEPRTAPSQQAIPLSTTAITPDMFLTRKEIREGRMARKVPSPLDKSVAYLAATSYGDGDDSTSDSESLASVEMLTDDQISSLMLDQEIEDCNELLLSQESTSSSHPTTILSSVPQPLVNHTISSSPTTTSVSSPSGSSGAATTSSTSTTYPPPASPPSNATTCADGGGIRPI